MESPRNDAAGTSFPDVRMDATSNLGATDWLKMTAQFTERREDDQFPGARQHGFVFELPGVFVRNVDGIEAELERGIDVAARAVTDHPAVRLHDLMLVDEAAVSLVVFLLHDFNVLEKSL